MAIRFECANIVTTVREIDDKYPGGYDNFKKKYQLGIHHWTDGSLVRLGDDPSMSDWLDNIGYDINIYDFQKEPPKEWHSYPDTFNMGCTPMFMWTDEQPEEPEQIENGCFLQGGYIYKSYFIWQKVNRWLIKWNNPNSFLYYLQKGDIIKGW